MSARRSVVMSNTLINQKMKQDINLSCLQNHKDWLSCLSLNSEGLLYSYTKCAVFLGLKDDENSGVTMVLTNKWMLVTQLDKPYM
jgi:hypothetical protein